MTSAISNAVPGVSLVSSGGFVHVVAARYCGGTRCEEWAHDRDPVARGPARDPDCQRDDTVLPWVRRSLGRAIGHGDPAERRARWDQRRLATHRSRHRVSRHLPRLGAGAEATGQCFPLHGTSVPDLQHLPRLAVDRWQRPTQRTGASRVGSFDSTRIGTLRCSSTPTILMRSGTCSTNARPGSMRQLALGPRWRRSVPAFFSVPTVPGRNWFAYFRFYQPTEAYFDRSWPLPDFELL